MQIKLISILVIMLLVFSQNTLAETNKNTTTPTTVASNNTTTNQVLLILREEPNDNAKIVTSLTKYQPLIPFHEQNGWLKVGNQQDGSVGWVKKQDFTNYQFASRFPHYSRTIITETKNDKGQPVYQILESNSANKMTQQQAANLISQMEQRQRLFQEQIHNMMENAFNTMPFMMATPPRVEIYVVPADHQKSEAPKTKDHDKQKS